MGDVLLVLASSEGGLISQTLAELGIDDRALAGALARARASGPSRLEKEIEETRWAKEEAIENRQPEHVARLREEELQLVSHKNERDERLLTRLGLSEEPGKTSPADSPA